MVNDQPQYRRIYSSHLQLAAEVKNDGSVSEFVFATSVNSADYMKQGTSHYRLIHDHLGSPRLVVNSLDGTIMQRLDYNEWGNVISDSNPNFQPFAFAGGLYDADTKLIKFGARDYNASIARWNSKDPILFAGGDTNLYRYVIGDPVNYFDPEGQAAISYPVILATGALATVIADFYKKYGDFSDDFFLNVRINILFYILEAKKPDLKRRKKNEGENKCSPDNNNFIDIRDDWSKPRNIHTKTTGVA